jgi:hypothetical protein
MKITKAWFVLAFVLATKVDTSASMPLVIEIESQHGILSKCEINFQFAYDFMTSSAMAPITERFKKLDLESQFSTFLFLNYLLYQSLNEKPCQLSPEKQEFLIKEYNVLYSTIVPADSTEKHIGGIYGLGIDLLPFIGEYNKNELPLLILCESGKLKLPKLKK